MNNNLKNRKHTEQKVLDLLWSIRTHDRFYFDTYGKIWLREMIKEHLKTLKNENSKQKH